MGVDFSCLQTFLFFPKNPSLAKFFMQLDGFDELRSAIFTTFGILLLSTQTGAMIYVSAAIFAVGVCYFWPNMIRSVAEKIPKSDALGLSVVGAIGFFSTSIF